MSKRTRIMQIRCAHDGCEEIGRFEYDNRTEYCEKHRRLSGTWKCSRHSHCHEVLSSDNRGTIAEMTVEHRGYGKFFGCHGFVHGPGFRAWAEDFPVGTKLIVTATIVVPVGDGK